ncbi:PREDICTED: target of Nesh-SH3 isoform X2 [Crocodylus porosus]|uniref:target of Nesh-SH3 isoform X2 n=1 Tax=Crocodylus porosus TaxID=8502 RepID=UPI00093F193B|nr:PREDICTED: target of Nesh-SH3 isoform X2 [Crocodylus porosus]
MISRLFFLLFCGHVALNPGNAQKLPRVKRQSLKVQINTTGDIICMKYLRPNPNTKLEGFIVGYGSSFYSNQYIPLPADGKSYMTEVDAEPRYLIVVRPARTSNKKTCSGQTKMSKPLQLVVGTLTPSSVFLSWGILVNPHHDWTAMSNCASDRFYTVRYREKDKNKKWAFQLCPATETVVENLKPNTLYEFGVKDNTEDGIWSKSFNHKTVLSSKAISGQLQNTYKVVPNGQTQLTLRDPKNLVPITIIKQVIQNITQRTSPKTTDRDRSSLPILVHLIIPGLNESLKKLPPALSIEDISQTVEKKLSKNETLLWPAESKTPEVQELSPQSLPGTSEPLQESIIPTVSGALEKSEASLAHSDSVLDSAKPSMTPKPELSLNKLAHSERASRLEETKSTSKPELAHTPTTLATSKLPELPKTKTSPPLRKPAGTLVTSKVPELPKTKTSPPLLKPIGTLVTSKLPEFPITKTSPPLLKPTGSLATSKLPEVPKIKTSPPIQKPTKSLVTSKLPEFLVTKTSLPLQKPIESLVTNKLQELPKTKTFSPLLKPTATLASKEMQPICSGSKSSDLPKMPQTKPAILRPTSQSTSLPPMETPRTSMAFDETQLVSSTAKMPGITELPSTESVTVRTTLRPITPGASKKEFVSYDFLHVSSIPQTPETSHTESATNSAELETSTPLISRIPHLLGTTMVFTDKQPVLPSPTTSDEPEISAPKPEKSELPLDSPTAKVSNLLKWPKATLAPNETSLVPSKLKPSATPEVQHVKPAPKPPLLEHSTPKTSRITDWPKTTLAPRETKFVPSTTKPTARPKMPRTRPAPSKAKPAPSKPKVSLQPEEPKTKPAATRESVPVPVTTKVSHTLEHPKATMASYEPQHTPSKSKASTSAMPEMTYSEPESSETQFIPLMAKSSVEPKMPQSKAVLEPITLRTEPPRSAIAPKETQHVPSRPKPSPKPHIPQTKPVLDPITLRTERPKTAIAPKETRRVPSKPKATQSPEMLSTKPVLEPITFRTEKPKATLAPKDTRRVYSKPSKTVPGPGVLPTKAGPKETRRVPLKPKTTPSPDVPQTKTVLASIAITTEQPKPTLALKETQYVPFKPKPSPTLDAPQTKPAEIIPSLQEPVTTITPEQTKATLASSEKHLIPSKPKASAKPGMPQTKPAIHQTTLQPLLTKPSTTPEQSKATMAPKETRLVPSKPKTSLRPEGPQTKAAPKTTSFGSINLHLVHIVDGSKVTLVPNETAQTSFNAKTARTPENPLLKTASDVVHTGTSSPKIAKPFGKPEATLAPHKVQLPSARSKASEKPHSRSALSRTTPGPGRTKTPGILRWDGPTTDGLTEEDIVKFTGKDLGISWESSVSKKRPISEMLPPDSKHPLLAPAKPTQVRRKPLPPNTVTGKPGSPVNVLVPQVPPSPMATMAQSAKPTNFVKTGAPRKSPTASATPEDFADATVFSSSPTSETDSLGKPRYTAPHVKYMKKEEDVPCSITSSLEYFPQEEGGSKEEPVQPPQNPPTNLTVVTVEGCPSFVILDWEKPDNDTVTEYEVVSTENGAPTGKEQSIITTNQTHSTVENLKPDTSYEFHVKPRNPLGEGPSSNTVAFNTESADPRVSEPISMGKDAIWTPIPFESDSYSECRGKQYVKRTWYKKFVGVQLCNSLRYKIYLSDSLTGKFYNIGDQRGHGEDHCQFVDSFLDGRTGQQVLPEQLPVRDGFFRAVRQEPVKFGEIGGQTHINYVHWYECGTSIPGKW